MAQYYRSYYKNGYVVYDHQVKITEQGEAERLFRNVFSDCNAELVGRTKDFSLEEIKEVGYEIVTGIHAADNHPFVDYRVVVKVYNINGGYYVFDGVKGDALMPVEELDAYVKNLGTTPSIISIDKQLEKRFIGAYRTEGEMNFFVLALQNIIRRVYNSATPYWLPEVVDIADVNSVQATHSRITVDPEYGTIGNGNIIASASTPHIYTKQQAENLFLMLFPDSAAQYIVRATQGTYLPTPIVDDDIANIGILVETEPTSEWHCPPWEHIVSQTVEVEDRNRIETDPGEIIRAIRYTYDRGYVFPWLSRLTDVRSMSIYRWAMYAFNCKVIAVCRGSRIKMDDVEKLYNDLVDCYTADSPMALNWEFDYQFPSHLYVAGKYALRSGNGEITPKQARTMMRAITPSDINLTSTKRKVPFKRNNSYVSANADGTYSVKSTYDEYGNGRDIEDYFEKRDAELGPFSRGHENDSVIVTRSTYDQARIVRDVLVELSAVHANGEDTLCSFSIVDRNEQVITPTFPPDPVPEEPTPEDNYQFGTPAVAPDSLPLGNSTHINTDAAVYGEVPGMLALQVDMGETLHPDWRWFSLPDDVSINMQFTSPIWDKEATSAFSHPVSIYSAHNLHIIGNAGTLHGTSLYKILHGRKFRLFYSGQPILFGIIKLNNNAAIEGGKFNITLASGNSEFEADINDLNARDLTPMDPNDWSKRLRLGTVVSGIVPFVNVQDCFNETSVWNGQTDTKWRPEHSRTEYKESSMLAIDSPSTIVYKNPYRAMSVHYGDKQPFCFIRRAWQRYKKSIKDNKEEWEKMEPRQYQTTDMLWNNEKDGKYQHYFSPCFYVAYWLDLLWKKLNYTVEQDDMLDYEDWFRLAFVNGTTGFDTCDTMSSLPKDEARFFNLCGISLKNQGTEPLNGYAEFDNFDTFVPYPDFYHYGYPSFDLQVRPNIEEAIYKTMKFSSDGFDMGQMYLSTQWRVTTEAYYEENRYVMARAAVISDVILKEKQVIAYANGDNFPDTEAKDVVNVLCSLFNLRFIYDSTSRRMRIVSVDRILKENTVIHYIDGDIISPINKEETGIDGYRLRYDTSDIEIQAKYNSNEVDFSGNDAEAQFNYTNFKNYDLRDGLEDVKGAISNSNKQVLIDTITGNAYRIRVDEKATNMTDLNESLFEVAQYIPYVYGDCGVEAEKAGRIKEETISCTPVTMNTISSNHGIKYGLFCDKEIRALWTESTPSQVLVKFEGIKYGWSGQFKFPFVKLLPYSVNSGVGGISNADPTNRIWPAFEEKIKPAVAIGLSHYEPVSFDHKSFDSEHPLVHQDFGFTLGFMRGPGNSGTDEWTHIQSADGNTAWAAPTCHYGNFHGDTMDIEGRLFDYNGDDVGIGGAFGKGQTTIYQEDVPYYLGLYCLGNYYHGLYTTDHADIHSGMRSSFALSVDDYNVNVVRSEDGMVVLATEVITAKDGSRMLITPITNMGGLIPLDTYKAEKAALAGMTEEEAIAYDKASHQMLIAVNVTDAVVEFIQELARLYFTSVTTIKARIPMLQTFADIKAEAISRLQKAFAETGNVDFARVKLATKTQGDEVYRIGDVYVPIYTTVINDGGLNICFFAGIDEDGAMITWQELAEYATTVCALAGNRTAQIKANDTQRRYVGHILIDEDTKDNNPNWQSDKIMEQKELMACAAGLASEFRTYNEIMAHTELHGRFSMKLKAEKPIPGEFDENGQQKYFPVADYAKGRGMGDKMHARYAKFLTECKVATINYSRINLSDLLNINYELQYCLGGITGFIKGYSYSLTNKGLKNVKIQLYYV